MIDFIVTEMDIRGAACTSAALYVDNKLTELEVQRNEKMSRVDQIVMAVVDRKVNNIEGTFLRITKNETAFSNDIRCKGCSKMPVQIRKDAYGHKGCVVSNVLQLTGIYSIVSMGKGRISYSSKLSFAEKAKLKDRMAVLLDQEGFSIDGFDIMIRTACHDLFMENDGEDAALCDQPLVDEIKASLSKLKNVLEAAKTADAYAVLYRPAPFYKDMLDHLRVKPDRVRSDIPLIARIIDGDLYQDPALSLAALKNLPSEIEKLLNRHVNLKSGAELVVDHTEAMTVIDVNSGKNIKGKDAQATYAAINREAIAEIIRQLRLRSISGMVLVDLIKLTDKQVTEDILKETRKMCRDEAIYTEAVDITGLGLLELVRQKRKASLWEIING
ncbi:MAG: ribonuclease E/G [Lachnospiraceae bacterium]|nr:ribonuclease E/G [Candidatus Equihabitans merdae]